MNRDTAELIVEALHNYGEDEAELYEDYSGRGMYGRNTTGVVVENTGAILPAVVEYLRDNVCEECDWDGIPDFESMRLDNLGLSYIVY